MSTRTVLILLAFTTTACTEAEKTADTAGHDADTQESTLPEFVDDCDEALNDSFTAAAGIIGLEGNSHTEVQLCTGDLDYYRVDIAPGEWLSVEIAIDGSGDNASDMTDLDLWQIEDATSPIDSALDMADDDADIDNVVWYSASEQPTEQLAWYNAEDTTVSRYLIVDGWNDATATYSINVRTTEFHDGLDCDDYFDDASESGPCNRIMQFPQAQGLDEGFVVSHEAHYSNLRREVAYLVRWAAEETAAAFEDTNPIGLLDMSQADGDTPGRMVGSLRHPEGTHVYGNDIDIAYYQNGTDNLGRPVCPQNDGYFCTGEPTLLDAPRTAYFLAMLMRSPNLRVIGVDPAIADAVMGAASALQDEGLIDGGDRGRLFAYLAYGDGWPFHHHHMHFSWRWEDGFEGMHTAPTQGCLIAPPDVQPVGKLRIGPGR